jgi:hypothetical protein
MSKTFLSPRLAISILLVICNLLCHGQTQKEFTPDFKPDFESTFTAAKQGNPYAVIYLLQGGDWTDEQKDRINSIERFKSYSALDDACKTVAALNPGTSPAMNYYCGVALAHKATYEPHDENDWGKNYPYLDYLEIAARNDYLDAIDQWEGIAVWGGARGIHSDVRRGYSVLEDIASKGNMKALKCLTEVHALHSGSDALPYAIKYARLTGDDEDYLNALEVLFRGDVELPLTKRLAKADSIISFMSSPGKGYGMVASNIPDEKANALLLKKYRTKALENGDPETLFNEGCKYYTGKVENLDLKKALGYFTRAYENNSSDQKKGWLLGDIFKYLYRINLEHVGWAQAKKYLNEWAKYSSSPAEAYMLLGSMAESESRDFIDEQKRRQKIAEAIELYKMAEKDFPEESLFNQVNLLGWAENPGNGFSTKGKAAAPLEKLKNRNTFASFYYMAFLNENVGDACSAMNWLNSYFKSGPQSQETFPWAIKMYSRLRKYCPARDVYNVNKLVDILIKSNPNDCEANWMYGEKQISLGLYASGLKSMKKALDLAIKQGKLIDYPYMLLDLGAYYQGLRGVEWQDKTYKIPVKYRKVAYGKKLEKLAFANFNYEED